MADDSFENRLKEIWHQGHRSMAAAFLRRAMTPETSLADVAKALQFDAVRDFLGSLRLADVLADLSGGPSLGGSPSAPTSPAAPAAPGEAVEHAASPERESAGARPRRRRRAAAEVAEMREVLGRLLEETLGSLTTTELHASLSEAGHDLDRLTLNRLLVQLEEDGRVVCLGGRPKSWRRATARAAKNEDESAEAEAEVEP